VTRLRSKKAAKAEHLAVAINGTLFSSKSGWWARKTGDLANAVNPVVADHIISHVWLDTYLLWFDDQLTPHLGPNKTTEAELAMAKWGIAGEDFGCAMAEFCLVTTVAISQMGEPQWPSICRASFCSWPSALIFLRI
jgi:hypothetical protein